MTLSGQIQFLAFNVFEGCVGLFWPSMMKARPLRTPLNTPSFFAFSLTRRMLPLRALTRSRRADAEPVRAGGCA